MSELDAVVIGSGPNGLAAAVRLAERGQKVLVVEARATIGGGLRTSALTLPGFVHDECSAVHTLGILSPYLRTLPLEAHGLRWLQLAASVAHPLDDGPAVLLRGTIDDTTAQFAADARAYRRLVAPFLADPHGLLADALAPLGWPRHPLQLARFGWRGMRSARGLARRFATREARALLAGCAGHSVLPLERMFTGAIALMFLVTGHVEAWPVAAGGSAAIAEALASLLRAHGGQIETGTPIRALAELPPAKAYLFDTDPRQLASIAEPVLPTRYVRRLRRYRFGPGAFKLDWALGGPIPWRDPRCLEATTLHVGGTFEEIAASEAAAARGDHSDRPFLIVCQQSQADPTRAPAGQHTGYAYCHVPAGSTVDQTAAIEQQIERFAPGFRERILARHVTTPADLEAKNPNYVGGAITGGMADIGQLFTRPVARWNPYTTPHRRIFLCSASTPPGGGVHGMCGYHAAETVLARIERLPRTPLA
ncbi:MAG: NAD(P)/FAD-dependent oxidoreductase [Deltaproteobacteria bacterium]|nr:NAD(P)/FAD-dependent oxidoreductase [Deltaproteobacteria bacterium]